MNLSYKLDVDSSIISGVIAAADRFFWLILKQVVGLDPFRLKIPSIKVNYPK